MSWYSHVVLPCLLDRSMSLDSITEQRRAVLKNVQGNILEIGFGTGLNLPHYPPHVHTLTVIDPNPGMNALARKRIAASPISVQAHQIGGEALPFPDQTFDTVVSTWTLCSIPDVARALHEIWRVLKPDGQFCFAEHGLSHEPRLQRWQHRLTPLQKRMVDGCHLDRDIDKIIEAQGFRLLHLDRFYLRDAPRFAGYMYRGVARKS